MADLPEFVSRISEYSRWNHAEKVKFFSWFLHTYEKKERVTGTDVARCYDALHDEQPSSIAPFLAAMEKKSPKEAIRDGFGTRVTDVVPRITGRAATPFAKYAANAAAAWT